LLVLADSGHFQQLPWEHHLQHRSTRDGLGHQGCHWLGEKLPSVVKGFGMNIWQLKRLLSGRTEILDVLTNKNAEYTLSEGFEDNKNISFGL
jgi:hypothetical protein